MLNKTDTIRILFVEDSEDDVFLIVREIEKGGFNAEYIQVDTVDDFRAEVVEKEWDIILSDYSLPGFNGKDILEIVRNEKINIPLIMVSGTLGEELAIDVLKSGASDFIVKGNYARLLPAIKRSLNEKKMELEKLMAEDKLRRSEYTLRALLNAPTESAVLVDTSGEILAVNETASELIGRPVSELIGLTLRECLPSSELVNQRLLMNQKVIETGKAVRFEDGQDGRFYDSSIYPVFGDHGEVISLALYSRDITEQKRLSERIEKSATEWRSTFDAIQDAVVLTDREGKILRCNSSFSKLMGMSFLEIQGEKCRDLIFGNMSESKDCPGERTLVSGKRESDITQFENMWLEVVSDPIFDNSEITGLVNVVKNITSRVESAEKLNKHHRTLQSICDISLSVPMSLTDVCSVVVSRIGELLNAQDTLIRINNDIGDVMIIPHRDECCNVEDYCCVNIVSSSGTISGAICFLPPAGEKISDDDMKIVEIFSGFIAHIVEKNKMQKELEEAQKMEMMGHLTGGVAHEVRNPLNAIGLLCEAMSIHTKGKKELEPFMKHIQEHVRRMTSLMDDLLSLGKPMPVKDMTEFSVLSACKEAIEVWSGSETGSRAKVVFLAEQGVETVKFKGIKDKIIQVIINLLDNAALNDSKGSDIEFTLETGSEDHVILKIIDRGSGIPSEHLEKIMTPFFTTRKGGTGLGLTLVQHIVKLHRGKINIANNESEGVTVEILLPVCKREDS